MCSVEPLREFIRERLTAAAEEIFTQLEKTIVRYEEEIDRQRRLLDLSWTRTEQNPAELPELEKDVQTHQQDSDFSLDQEKPEQWQMTREREEPGPPQMALSLEEPELLQLKEEDGEIWISRVEEQLVLNQQTDSVMKEREPEPDGGQRSSQRSSQSSSQSSSQRSSQRSSQNYHEAQNLNQNQRDDGDSGPSRAAGLKLSNRGRAKGKRLRVGNRAFCQICGKSFNQFYLYNHIRTHTGEKRFSCQICGKGFIQSYQYTVHMRTHTGERPFSCHVCGKRFVQKNNVVTHMKVHVGEKGFACEVCGVCFSLSADLTRHTAAAHSQDKPFTFQPPE